MISRRKVILAALTAPYLVNANSSHAQDSANVVGESSDFLQLPMPSIASLDDASLFGFKPATAAQIAKAQAIIDATPKGPTPFAIAQSFIERFYGKDNDAISQWPAPSNWNPLVKEFFTATSLRANDDMVDWCAAFVNWCIERNNKNGTDSAASQSFVNSGKFKKADKPEPGNLVVFTCYDKTTNKSLGIGHVCFLKEILGVSKIRVIGGNQSADGHSSIICERDFVTTPFEGRRHVDGVYVPCIIRLNAYLIV